MKPVITAFEASPDKGQGMARDMRVRLALEEIGQPYDVRLMSFAAMKQPAHLALHPFEQIPTYQAADLAIFESGAIVFHLATHHAGLLPDEGDARARSVTWMFAALNTVEPPIVELEQAEYLFGDRSWYDELVATLQQRVRARLDDLARRLGEAEWLDGTFSAGDLLMVTVLRRVADTGILRDYPTLAAHIARGEARPAYARAFADQLAVFTDRAGRDG